MVFISGISAFAENISPSIFRDECYNVFIYARNVNVIFNVSFLKSTREKAQELFIVAIRNLDLMLIDIHYTLF